MDWVPWSKLGEDLVSCTCLTLFDSRTICMKSEGEFLKPQNSFPYKNPNLVYLFSKLGFILTLIILSLEIKTQNWSQIYSIVHTITLGACLTLGCDLGVPVVQSSWLGRAIRNTLSRFLATLPVSLTLFQ